MPIIIANTTVRPGHCNRLNAYATSEIEVTVPNNTIETMKMLLSFDAHAVETACDGRSALKKLESLTFDLVFTDLSMPGMSGEALANAIKKKSPQQIVVMLTGKTEPLDRRHSDPSPFDFRLSKPFHLHELRDIIHKATLPQPTRGAHFDSLSRHDWLKVQRNPPKRTQ